MCLAVKVKLSTENLVICYKNHLPAKSQQYPEFGQYSSLSGVISSVLVETKHFIFFLLQNERDLTAFGAN